MLILITRYFGQLIGITNDSRLGRSRLSFHVGVFSSQININLYAKYVCLTCNYQKVGSFGPLFRTIECGYLPPFTSLQFLELICDIWFRRCTREVEKFTLIAIIFSGICFVLERSYRAFPQSTNSDAFN